MSQTRRRAAQQRPGRESAHSLGSILSRVYAVAASPPRPLPPPLQPPQQARLSPRIAAASQRPKGRPTLRRSTAGAASAGAAVVAAAAAAAAAACSPTAAGRGDRTHRSGHWAMVNRFRDVVLFFQNRARIVVRGLNMFARRHTPGATLRCSLAQCARRRRGHVVKAEGLRLRLYAGRGEKVALAHI